MVTPIAFDVLPYSPDALAVVLSNEWVDAASTRRKRHFHYFAEYLGSGGESLHAATIVVEKPYLSQSFLDDYADYYARGFRDYPRTCTRVHFFRHAFARADLLAALADPAVGTELWASYLGYVVVKPLPARQIGATLLRPYPATTANRRHYPVGRSYGVNLLGKQLEITTLIFQEQDSNVSACATTALWMAFHRTAGLFQTPLPSPYQITAAARTLFNRHGRNFPSAGLDQTQIGEAIQAVGLVTELRTYRQRWEEWPDEERSVEEQLREQLRGAQGFLYAYLRLGLPILLFVLLDEDPQQGHLVTVTGYRLAATPVPASPEFSLVAHAIDRLYAHDDQMGPYARYSFANDGTLVTPWPADANWATAKRWKTHRRASLYSMFVPITAQVRITYEQVYRQVALFQQLLSPDTVPAAEDVVWDVYLALSNDYKDELRRTRPVTEAPLERLLTTALPKYVWVARALLQQTPILELVFDATDLHTAFYCLLINVFTPLRASLRRALAQARFRQQLLRAPGFDARFLTLLVRDLDLVVPNLPPV
ncbi:hypothetical protein Q5H93_23500 [Hymenobacter sp. ASUV-10]|uniref:Uncharacterized protein n=1 Tax=Hymenobacter aranciens TaxID=3063996 RepID=A0ABT9BL45_9BACT|nr:hypothetical protein [Hymenobacter sp. ASUV-10]MDO7877722.1 hypothetical protein [Hymenobacter sp. ASUV-10]